MYKAVNELIIREQANTSRNNLGSWNYGYDAASNPIYETATGHTMRQLESSRSYAYDTLNRLTNALVTDSQAWAGLAQSTTTYSYDDLGNRISHSNRGAAAIGHGHDKANRMTALDSVNPAYDLAGNLTLAFSEDRGTSYKYRYDHLNRLTGLYDSTNTTRVAAFVYDAFGRRIESAEDVNGNTQRYYYDGANEVASINEDGTTLAHWVHGLSYIDERVMMWTENRYDGHISLTGGPPYSNIYTNLQRPYYYTIDRMYNARALVDRAGALVERYVYDPYGKPLIRESAGRGDMNNDGTINTFDITPFVNARDSTSWDPRADLNDDGLVDGTDSNAAWLAKNALWAAGPTVAQAFSDVGNPFMFQGRPNFPIDTALSATSAKNWLNDFRNRFADPTGRWLTRDPIGYAGGINSYELLASRPTTLGDPFGFNPAGTHRNRGDGNEGELNDEIAALSRVPSNGGHYLRERTAEAVLGVTDRGIAIANGIADEAYRVVNDPIMDTINRAADSVINRTSFFLSLFWYGVDPRDFSYTTWDQRLGAGLMLYGDLLGFVEFGLQFIHFECFAEGTLVATPDGPVRIETLKVGDRVVSDKSDCDLQWMDFPDDLLQIDLQAFKVDGSAVDITLLRSKGWVSDAGVAPGRTVELTIPEIALAGDATVLSVGPAPTIRKGPGRVIRSTIRSLSDEVLEVSFEDGSQPLLVTVQHRLFSADRNDWVAARDLHEGETLQTRHGFLRIKSIQLTDRRYFVYNLQVDADNTYFVASGEVLCHNAYPGPFGGDRPDGKHPSKANAPKGDGGAPNAGPGHIGTWWYYNKKTGRWEVSTLYYDDTGKLRARTDHTDHGQPGEHTDPHHHIYDDNGNDSGPLPGEYKPCG